MCWRQRRPNLYAHNISAILSQYYLKAVAIYKIKNKPLKMINDCKIIELPKITDQRGNLTFIEGNRHVPFDIKRIFYIYDIPSGVDRGAHAHIDLHQYIVCLSGGLSIYIDDGNEKKTIILSRPWMGLYIPPMTWASEGDFNPGTVYMVLTSDVYRSESYIRDYDQFLKKVRNNA
jgi:dTDP-4-dehydrorhamnose 3,5-epimerase-like enzyme